MTMDVVELSLPTGDQLAGLPQLVAGGIGQRLALEHDGIDALQSTLGGALEIVVGDRVSIVFAVGAESISLRVAPTSVETDADAVLDAGPAAHATRHERDGQHWLELDVIGERPQSLGWSIPRSDPPRLASMLVAPSKADYLVLARLLVASLAHSAGATESTIAALKLAVTEAASNAVRHAYPDGNGRFAVTAEVDTSLMRVTVTDAGVGFDPPTSAELPREPRQGGMGLPLVAAMSDATEIGSNDSGGTTVTFVKRLSAD
ncbi:MAG: ATP-binding protein [Gaiella sp.]